MQIRLTRDEQALVFTMLVDSVSSATKAKDRAVRRYAERLLGKFDLSIPVVNIKMREAATVLNLLEQFKKMGKDMTVLREDRKVVAEENMRTADELTNKLINSFDME